MAKYVGTYENVAYGKLTICDRSPASPSCQFVLSDFDKVDSAQSLPLPPSREIPQLFAQWPRFWSSHARFVHCGNNTFDLALTNLFTEGYGDSKTPFEAYEMDTYEAQVEFVVVDGEVVGFGFFGEGEDMSRNIHVRESVQENAIVWFEKIKS